MGVAPACRASAGCLGVLAHLGLLELAEGRHRRAMGRLEAELRAEVTSTLTSTTSACGFNERVGSTNVWFNVCTVMGDGGGWSGFMGEMAR
jgi:hypothetical protein